MNSKVIRDIISIISIRAIKVLKDPKIPKDSKILKDPKFKLSKESQWRQSNKKSLQKGQIPQNRHPQGDRIVKIVPSEGISIR